MIDSTRPIVVVGAGVAGLALADALQRLHIGPVMVFERHPFAGGLAATHAWEGCLVDFGPHRLLSHYPEVDALIEELVGQELVYTERKSAILLPRGLVPYPGSPLAVIRGLGLAQGSRAAATYFAARLWHSPQPEKPCSYEEYLVRLFGRGLYEAVFETFPLKVWGLPGSDIDADAAKIRLASKGLFDTLRDMVLRTGKTLVRKVAYPALGVGRIAERLVERIQGRGGRVALGCRVTGLTVGPDGVDTLAIADNNGRCSAVPVRQVAFSLPIGDLAQMVATGGGGAAVAQAASSLRVHPVRLVYVLLRKERFSANHWMYFPGQETVFTRLYEPKAFSLATAPPDKTVICVETSCLRGWTGTPLTDEEARQQVLDGLAAAGLLRENEVEAVCTVQVADAYPVLRAGYATALRETLNLLALLPNCYCLGRQGLFSYNNTDLSIKMGLDLARHLAEGAAPRDWYRYASDTYSSYRIID